MATIKPYDNQGDKKEQVERMFDSIAPYYDLLNRVLSLGIDRSWRKKSIRQLKEIQPGKILDVATGTGDLAIECKRQFPDAEIHGVDLSAEMIRVGRDKLSKKGLNDIKLDVGDSENLPYSDNTYDAATVAFGVRNFGNLTGGLAEIFRVIRPGGRLVVLEFSRPRIFPFKQLFNAYFKYILPFIGRIGSKDPKAYRYLYESVQAFPDYDRFTEKLESVGFKSLYYKPLTLGICCIYVAEK